MKNRLFVIAPSLIGLACAGPTHADVEITGFLKNETAFFTQDAQTIGQATTTLDTSTSHSGLMKFENSAKVFINADITDNATFHGELNLINDTEGTHGPGSPDYRLHTLYSQHDWLREYYVDAYVGDTAIRIGKQQVVWGTADGIKLLDIINPTDFREFNQNTFEDSRIPIHMANIDIPVGESGSLQLIVAQNEENKIPGLNAGGDQGHPFVMKGVDSITGKVNGFQNIVPALGAVAGTFDGLARAFFAGAGLSNVPGALGANSSVNGFSTNTGAAAAFGGACPGFGVGAGTSSSECLDAISQTTNTRITNLIDPQAATGGVGASPQWTPGSPNSTFEYLSATNFATFDQYVGIQTRYVRDDPDELDPNVGARYRGNVGGDFNFSVNYLYAYDPNPSVRIRVVDSAGTELSSNISDLFGLGERIVTLTDGAGNMPCSADAAAGTHGLGAVGVGAGGPCTVEFVESQHRIHNLGGSFDTSFDTDMFEVPVVVRGEFLYQKDTRVPVINRTRLGVGDLVNGLKPMEADMFKYVLGVDVTVLTNLLISGQFIQSINLDYIDENFDTLSRVGCGTTALPAACGRYTGDPTTLHLSNNLQQGEEFDNFGSLFFSKPFGPSQEHRWNNITIYEEGGGVWNRFDLEYTFTDRFLGTAEWNWYGGDRDTTFGQLHNSSSVQVGLKYLFE